MKNKEKQNPFKPLEAVKNFETKLVCHPRHDEAYEQLARAVSAAPPETIVAVVGPTGAGKSTLSKRVRKEYLEHEAAAMQAKKHLPVIRVEIPATQSNSFSWRPLMMAMLNEMGEPLIDKKIDIEATLKQRLATGGNPPVYPTLSHSLAILEGQMHKAVERNGVDLILLDEAQHLKSACSSSALSRQMDVIKSLSNRLGKTRLVLFGTGEMIELLDQSAQLSRRIKPVRLMPYGNSTAEMKDFGGSIKKLIGDAPLPSNISMSDCIQYFYDGTLGVFGLMADWCRLAFANAIQDGSDVLELKHFEATRFEERTLQKVKGEIEACEMFFNGDLARRAVTSAPQSKHLGSHLRPGQHKPIRRAVGLERAA